MSVAEEVDVPADFTDPERALLACLLRLDVPRAVVVLALVQPDDLAAPVLAEVLTAIAYLVGTGVVPEPSAVYMVLRERIKTRVTALQVVDDRTVEETHQRRVQYEARLTTASVQVLTGLYGLPVVPASALFYVARVLEEAARRRAQEGGTRIAQAAELMPMAELSGFLIREATAIHTLIERARQAAA